MNLKDYAKGRSDLLSIAPADIHVDPEFNIRFQGSDREARIAHLVNAIKAQGVQTPLKVRLKDDLVYVVDGHTRLEAVRRINLAEPGRIETLPCLPEKRGTTDADRHMMLLSNNDSEPLAAVEKAALFKRQMKLFGWTEARIAEAAGMSEKQVQNLLELSAASDEVKEIVSSGAMAATQAIKVIKQVGAEKATPIIQQAVKDAQEQGRSKATAKTMAPAKSPAPAPALKPSKVGLAADLLGMAPLPATPTPTPQVPAPQPPAPRAAAGVVAANRALLGAMREILNLDDVAVIHTVVRDTLFEHDAEMRAA